MKRSLIAAGVMGAAGGALGFIFYWLPDSMQEALGLALLVGIGAALLTAMIGAALADD